MIEKAKVTLEVTAKITDEFIEFQSEAIGTAFGRWGYKKLDIEKALIELEAYKGTALTPNEIVSLKERKNDGERFEFDFSNVKSFDCQCGRHYVNTGVPTNDSWIPVEERLPEAGEHVLASFKSDGFLPATAIISENGRWSMLQGAKGFNDVTEDVIAWSPLPEPYRPERSDNNDGE